MKKTNVPIKDTPCPCGSNMFYDLCCGPHLDGKTGAGTAEALMRSRYTAYVLMRESYLRATWHPSTRPTILGTDNTGIKWIGLQVLRHEQQNDVSAIVEFIARYKVHGRAQRLHEVSRFVHEEGRWLYVEGQLF